jgi:hypothetical protein
MRCRVISILGIASVILAGCAAMAPPPSGPTVVAVPANDKTFGAFQSDNAQCESYASSQLNGTPNPNNQVAAGAVVGTVAGAGLGAAVGVAAHAPGAGAAIGGATGLVAGTAIGANNAQASSGNLQQRYDVAYTQCMYAHGNSVQAMPVEPPQYYPYGYYPYPYPYYGYPYGGFYGPGFAGAFGFGFGFDRFGHRGFFDRHGFHPAGFHGGGFHGGGGHGGGGGHR